jgi:hypothetical protein
MAVSSEWLLLDDEAEADDLVRDREGLGWRLVRRQTWPDGSVAVEMRLPRNSQCHRSP